MKTEPTSLRLDAETKHAAYEVFEKVGLKPSQAINLFLKQVVLVNGLPFPISVPNRGTREAIEELNSGEGMSFDDTESFYKDLGIEP